ncbi:hypothetical protein CSU94_19030 [Salmonella enterica subsp. houtenae]|nr:hypothetical protein [Salmonella enterica subsp. houtenae]
MDVSEEGALFAYRDASNCQSALSVVVNAQADAQRRAEAGVHSIAIHIAVTLSGKPEISTGHYNLTAGTTNKR